MTPEEIWKRYLAARAYNDSLRLDSEVEENENFYVGKQWEGVKAAGLPTPVYNFLKQAVMFVVATVAGENPALRVTPLGSCGRKAALETAAGIAERELEAIFENNGLRPLLRRFLRNAAVDGDACLYVRWDPDRPTGQAARGYPATQVVENTRVYFGNPCDPEVQSQPWILIEKQELLAGLRRRLVLQGRDPSLLSGEGQARPHLQRTLEDETERVTVLVFFSRDPDTGRVRCSETTQHLVLEEGDLGLSLYPLVWMNWDRRPDCYHGQALISGLIPNQKFVNKAMAMAEVSLMSSAFPKVVYDKTRIASWTNQVGTAVGVNGGDVKAAAATVEGSSVSPQISQFVEMAMTSTKTLLGATPTALGETEPENTSAILALQRAAATPHELTRDCLRTAVEDLGRIYLGFMQAFYGRRLTAVPRSAAPCPGLDRTEDPDTGLYDFVRLGDFPLSLKLEMEDAGFWTRAASLQTLDRLLEKGLITLNQYLDRLPEGYVPEKEGLKGSC